MEEDSNFSHTNTRIGIVIGQVLTSDTWNLWWAFHTAPELNLGFKKIAIETKSAAMWRMNIWSFWCITQKDLLGKFWDIEFFLFLLITPCCWYIKSYKKCSAYYFTVSDVEWCKTTYDDSEMARIDIHITCNWQVTNTGLLKGVKNQVH